MIGEAFVVQTGVLALGRRGSECEGETVHERDGALALGGAGDRDGDVNTFCTLDRHFQYTELISDAEVDLNY